MQILEELYLSYLNGGRNQLKSLRHNEGYAKTLESVSECENKLVKALSDEVKELFYEYVREHQSMEITTDCETFIHGFKMGAKIMLDVLTVGEVRGI